MTDNFLRPLAPICALVNISTVKLVAQIKLLPTTEQRTALLSTMERFNAACDWLAVIAFDADCSSKLKLKK